MLKIRVGEEASVQGKLSLVSKLGRIPLGDLVADGEFDIRMPSRPSMGHELDVHLVLTLHPKNTPGPIIVLVPASQQQQDFKLL